MRISQLPTNPKLIKKEKKVKWNEQIDRGKEKVLSVCVYKARKHQRQKTRVLRSLGKVQATRELPCWRAKKDEKWEMKAGISRPGSLVLRTLCVKTPERNINIR